MQGGRAVHECTGLHTSAHALSRASPMKLARAHVFTVRRFAPETARRPVHTSCPRPALPMKHLHTILPVDAADHLVDVGAQVLVLVDVDARGHRNLDQDDLCGPARRAPPRLFNCCNAIGLFRRKKPHLLFELGMLAQEDLKRVQLLWDSCSLACPSNRAR